jgi:multidrug resistance efflux pump/transcriptional regulator with GAF, ATPase, and Fis domain
MMQPSNDAFLETARLLLAAPDSGARAALIASAVAEILPDSACAVHRYRHKGSEALWTAVAVAGDLSIEPGSQLGGSTLIEPLLSGAPEPLLFSISEIQREDYAHLHITRSVASLAYVPLLSQDQLVGAIEILSFANVLEPGDLTELAPIFRLAPAALLAAEEVEGLRQNLFDSIHRLTQLYDLEKSLNATLDLDQVIAMIPEKTIAMLECQAMHLWLFDAGRLRLTSISGYDPTIQVGAVQGAGDGYVGDMAEEGEPLLIADPKDERLQARNASISGREDAVPVTGALLVSLFQDGDEVGVLEAVNKQGRPFDEDDEFFLVSMAETVSSSLKNASLMFAERKLEILEALVRVSSEITSTLRLDRLLQIIVNSPSNVLPFERCSIALDSRGRLQLKSVSGMASIPLGDAQVDKLNELLRWLSVQPGRLHLRRKAAPEATPELPSPVAAHFDATGYRAIYSLPLADDQGRVGLLLYESSDPDFLDLPHTEMISILAGQATVAIRNALLYREVPLINLLEPLMQRKQAIFRSSFGRRMAFAAVAAAIALFLIFCPLPMRVTGAAVISPQHMVTIAAPVAGNVAAVFAHEGQRVGAGDVLGTMTDWQWRMELASSEARYKEALLVMESDLAHGSAQAGADRSRSEFLNAEVSRASSRLDGARLRSPIAGIVVTPDLQNAAGEHLDAGAPFAQVLDLSSAEVDIAVPQSDAALVRPGQKAAVKLDSYPQRSWRGAVSIVSPQAQAGDGERTFAARVPLPNDDALLRSGMAGGAKISIGWRPAGYVLLRRPALWIWQTLWNWIGW